MPTVNQLEREWAKQDDTARERVVLALLEHTDGRKFLHWLLSIGNAIGTNPYIPQDSLHTAFNCGTMQVGHRVMQTILDANPDGFTATLKEAEDERQARDRERAGAEPERGTDYHSD